MIDATLIQIINRIGGPYGDRECLYCVHVFMLPTIPANDSEDFRFLIGSSIGIEVLKIYCESESYSIEIFNKETLYGFNKVAHLDSIDKWKMIGGNMGENGTYITINRDNPQTSFVYATITNDDAKETGPIHIEFMVSDI